MDKSHERSHSSKSTFGSEQEAALQKLVVTFQDLIVVLGGLGGNHHAIRVEDAVGLPDVQQAGADAFSLFEKRAKHLDKELTSFVNATRTLGGSAGIRAASVVLRGRLDQILLLFHKNARYLFPTKVPPVSQEGPTPRLKGDIVLQNAKSQGVGKGANVGDSNAENWPDQLEQFAADVDHLLSYVDDFSTEFIDEAVSDTSLPLVTDLKYWASCLKIYKGRFESPEIQTYLHELTEEFGRHLENIAISLSTFIEVGIPSIRYAQKHGNKTLLHLSTVATFFSAVTATTLQYSYAQTPVTTLSNLVNGFWFSSLLLSSGAALNTWLVLTWKDAHYRSPRHQLPVWVSFWITHSPPVFLILSSMCFLIGLILFVYSSPGQARGTHIAATFVFACSCLGLCVISIWFAAERWIFSHYKGVKRLSEVLADSPGLIRLPLAISSWFFQEIHRATCKMAKWSVKVGNEVVQAINAAIAGARERRQARETFRVDVESRPVPNREPESPTRIPSTITPLAAIPELGPAQTPGTNSSDKDHEGRPADTTQAIPLHKRLVNRLRSAPSEVAVAPDLPHAQYSPTRSSRRTGPSPTSMENLIRSMIVYGRAQAESISASNGVPPPKRKGTGSTEGSRPHSTDFTTVPTLHHGTFTYLLKRLEATQNLRSHQALVSHLQFSPDGKFLATSSWDSTVRILGVGMPYRSVHILAHPKRLVTKVVWSPDGEMLLTMVARGINIWTKDGVRKNTITRRNDVKSISWMPNSKAFLSVEEREVVMFDLGGTAMHTYKLDRVSVQDVAVTTDGERMLCVGALTASPDGFKPKSSQVEKQIIVFNFEKKETESRVPVLNEVRDVKLARHARDQLALVSYKNKAQLWKLNIDPERKTVQPTLRHTYISKLLAELAGACQFGGRHDEFVLGASEGGLIYIWDRDDGALLHSFVGKGQTMERDIVMSCIAWNHVADPFTFATGCSDGVVKIWAAKDKKAPNDPWSEALPFFDINLLSDTPYENDEHPLAFPGIA